MPFALNSSYVSCTIKAIVTPSLCVPLLLGLPFLVANHIVADFVACTAIDKQCNFDLLNPPLKAKTKKFMEPVMSIANVKKEKKAMLDELMLVCKECLKNGKGTPEFVKPLNTVVMIRDRIEVLALQEKFSSLEKNFLSEFKDIFEPLPHVGKLPWNITAQIKLKNVEQTIKTRTYTCPWKFCKAWQTLIQQHLDAGCICPLLSPHALPTFIIPNSDSSVLPRVEICTMNGAFAPL